MATMTKIRDLREGDLIDLQPSLQWLHAHGIELSDTDVMMMDAELSVVVESTHTEPPMDMGAYQDCLEFGEPEVGVFGVESLGQWALPADLEIPVHGRLDVAA